MDREGLINELSAYKKFSMQQYETIRLLKVEIQKIKKLAAQKEPRSPKQKEAAPKPLDTLLNGQPKDEKTLREEIAFLRQVVNEAEEEKKLLKANSLKYERRAKYTLEKFNEIKAKEMQLI